MKQMKNLKKSPKISFIYLAHCTFSALFLGPGPMMSVQYGGGDNSGYGSGGGGLGSDPRDPGGYNLTLVGGGAVNMRKGTHFGHLTSLIDWDFVAVLITKVPSLCTVFRIRIRIFEVAGSESTFCADPKSFF